MVCFCQILTDTPRSWWIWQIKKFWDMITWRIIYTCNIWQDLDKVICQILPDHNWDGMVMMLWNLALIADFPRFDWRIWLKLTKLSIQDSQTHAPPNIACAQGFLTMSLLTLILIWTRHLGQSTCYSIWWDLIMYLCHSIWIEAYIAKIISDHSPGLCFHRPCVFQIVLGICLVYNHLPNPYNCRPVAVLRIKGQPVILSTWMVWHIFYFVSYTTNICSLVVVAPCFSLTLCWICIMSEQLYNLRTAYHVLDDRVCWALCTQLEDGECLHEQCSQALELLQAAELVSVSHALVHNLFWGCDAALQCFPFWWMDHATAKHHGHG